MFAEYLTAVMAGALFAGMGWGAGSYGGREMFLVYLMDNETHDYAIMRRYKRPRIAVMYKNESVWIVPGTVGFDD